MKEGEGESTFLPFSFPRSSFPSSSQVSHFPAACPPQLKVVIITQQEVVCCLLREARLAFRILELSYVKSLALFEREAMFLLCVEWQYDKDHQRVSPLSQHRQLHSIGCLPALTDLANSAPKPHT